MRKTTEDEDDARRRAEYNRMMPQIAAALLAKGPCKHGADCLECEAERISGGPFGDLLTPDERRFIADYDAARQSATEPEAPVRSAYKMRQIIARLAPYPRHRQAVQS